MMALNDEEFAALLTGVRERFIAHPALTTGVPEFLAETSRISEGKTFDLFVEEVQRRALADAEAAPAERSDEDVYVADGDAIRIFLNSNLGKKWSRGKMAAHAVHAALKAFDVHPDVPVLVLGAKPRDIEKMRVQIRDAGRTELEPGTLTAGTDYEPERPNARSLDVRHQAEPGEAS